MKNSEIIILVNQLHSEGKTITETIKEVRFRFGLSLAESKLTVTSQPCWQLTVSNSATLHAEALEMVKKSS